jgi:TorA maturation chaperone TorD
MNSSVRTMTDWTETLTGQTLLFGVLAKVLYQYPEKDWIDTLIAEDIFAEVPFAGAQPDVIAGLSLLQSWSRAHRGGISQEAFDAIRIDHTRLFLGPGKVLAAPWESVHFNEERLVFQQETLQVRGWYSRFGLEVAKLHQEPDDHIGLELEFLAHLANLGMQALQAQDQKRFDELLDAQRKFLTEHLLKWSPVWCGLVIQHARTDFYRGVAQLTNGSLLELAKVLAIPMPELVKTKSYD